MPNFLPSTPPPWNPTKPVSRPTPPTAPRSNSGNTRGSALSNISNTSNQRTTSLARYAENVDNKSTSINCQATRRTLEQFSSIKVDEITHKQAKEIIYALGVSKKLYAEAHRDTVRDTIVNSVVKQFAALPTRFVKYALLSPAFLKAEPTLSKVPTPAELAAKQAYDAHKKMLTYAGQHLRGTSHFVMNTLVSPLDLSSGARSLPPRPFHPDSELKKIIFDKINSALDSYDTLLSKNDPALGLDLDRTAIEKTRNKLVEIKKGLQKTVDHLLEDQALCHNEEGQTIDTVLLGIAEIIDTIGKVVIDTTLRASGATGNILSTAGAPQLWSAISYPTMDGIITAVHNWRDANALARIALNQYQRFATASAKHAVSDKEIQALADYAQSHFESEEVANHKRRLVNIFEPRLLELNTKIAEKEIKLENTELRVDANSLKEFDSINKKIGKQDKIYRTIGEIDIDADEYSASMNMVAMMTNYLQNAQAAGLQDVSALMAFNIDSLLTVYCIPTAEASQYVANFEAALQQFYENNHLQEFERYYQSQNFNVKLKDKKIHKEFMLQQFNNTHKPQEFNKDKLLDLFDTFINNNLEKYRPIKGVDYRHKTPLGQNPFTPAGLEKQLIFNKFDKLSENFKRLKEIHVLEKEINILDKNIIFFHFHPEEAHDGAQEQEILRKEKKYYSRKIAQYKEEIPRLKWEAKTYKTDVKNYKDKRIDLIKNKEIKKAITNSNTGAGAAFINHLKYEIFTTANRRKTLGIAMNISYDPSIGMMGLHAQNIVQNTFINNVGEGVLDFSNLVPVLAIPIGANLIQPPSNGINRTTHGFAGSRRPNLSQVRTTIVPEVRDALGSNSGR